MCWLSELYIAVAQGHLWARFYLLSRSWLACDILFPRSLYECYTKYPINYRKHGPAHSWTDRCHKSNATAECYNSTWVNTTLVYGNHPAKESSYMVVCILFPLLLIGKFFGNLGEFGIFWTNYYINYVRFEEMAFNKSSKILSWRLNLIQLTCARLEQNINKISIVIRVFFYLKRNSEWWCVSIWFMYLECQQLDSG